MNIASPAPNLAKESLRFESIDALRFPLVDRFYHAQGYKIRCGRNERLFALSHPEHGLIAAARLVPQASGVYWLRNLLVVKMWRQQGIGHALMEQLLSALGSDTNSGPHSCYCFALKHVEQFYLRLHFRLLEPDACDFQIAERYKQYRARGRDWLLMGYSGNPGTV